MTNPEMPAPPFPEPDAPELAVVIQMALDAYDKGEADVRGAIIYAAVHGWLEGHLQGEECDQNCIQSGRWFGQPKPEEN